MTSPDGRTRPRLGYAVAFLERRIRRALTETLGAFELTLAQYTVLSLLGMHEGLSNAQLARRAYVTPQAMSEIIRHLEQRGLLVRSPSPGHARIHPARLTPNGRRTLRSSDAAVDAVERAMVEEAGVDDVAQLIDTLISCARTFDRTDGPAEGNVK